MGDTKAPRLAFISYGHDDDEEFGGAVVRLQPALDDALSAKGIRARTFLDRRDLRGGEEWERTISAVLGETTVLIPILTPHYFTRPHCRAELRRFLYCGNLGLSAFVLPLYFEQIPKFDSANRDKLVVRVARMHYIDWRERRLEDPAAPAYRQAIAELADRVAAMFAGAEEYEQRQLSRGPTRTEQGQLKSALDRIAKLMPSLLYATDMERLMAWQLDVTRDVARRRHSARHPPSTRQDGSRIDHHAHELIDRERRRVSYAEHQLKVARALDPLVEHVVGMVNDVPATRALIGALEAELRLVAARMGEPAGRTDGMREPLLDEVRTLPELAAVPIRIETLVTAAREIVYRWRDQLGLRDESQSAGSGAG